MGYTSKSDKTKTLDAEHRDIGGFREMWGTETSTSHTDETFYFPSGLSMPDTSYNLQITSENTAINGDSSSFCFYTKLTNGIIINRDNDIEDGDVSFDWRVIGKI
jgi:hypothetical protein